MKVLLDTQTFLWMQSSPERFRESSRALLEDGETELYLSSVSSWEIAIKHSIGRLALPVPPEEYVPTRMESSNTLALGVQHIHALRTASLPLHHGDPFDRLLVAQAQIEKLPILSADRQLAQYEIEVIEA